MCRNAGELDLKVIINGYFIWICFSVIFSNGKGKKEEGFSPRDFPSRQKATLGQAFVSTVRFQRPKSPKKFRTFEIEEISGKSQARSVSYFTQALFEIPT